ncbi:uncharacterized protein si:ch211-227n13.3 isoform X2 [Hemiscyllium ocellatum]|uniref:uncharacterized protein si:ch211-227n13.3 isoform X2 n=1 Tax=Hemiscyllium ocellatum TaxID=170820 RepID=UPI002966C13E|nr:uncharacterized protein si:ch211-227n13.3 isoform X2 [Hemiscyllium ocellatum]
MWTSGGRCAGRTDCTSRQNNSLSQVEVESAFRQLYSSLCGTKEKVEKTALENDHFATTTISEDLDKPLGLENLTVCSILSEQLALRNSDSGRATTSICSSESQTARHFAKESNLKLNTLLTKAKEKQMSNGDTLFFTVKQPVSQIEGSTLQNHDGNEEENFELSREDYDCISTNSGEDYRETVTCEACSNVYWKVMNRKRTKKRHVSHKKSPYDPTSLSCDQWILKKPLLPRGPVQRSKRESWYLKSIGTSSQSEATGKWIPQCSRPHVFLQRWCQTWRVVTSTVFAKFCKLFGETY